MTGRLTGQSDCPLMGGSTQERADPMGDKASSSGHSRQSSRMPLTITATTPQSSLRRFGPDSSTEPDGTVKKRRRGAARLSCAECRRLKLRCDRKVPCDSCVKRGCGAICPDGSLTTGKGNRFVLASTQELHEKISELCSRVRELEDALRAAYSQITDDKHPLLTEELLRIKAPLQRENNATTNSELSIKEEQNPDVVDSFGSLRISQTGRTKYYGHIANSWYFLQNETLEDAPEDRLAGLENVLPPEILALRNHVMPSSPSLSPTSTENERLKTLSWYIPAFDRATYLRDIYYERAAWMYNPVPLQQFNEEILPWFYQSNYSPPTDESAASHRLALLFMVLAIGALMDPEQPAYGLEAEKFHQVAKAALFQTAMTDDPTLNAVQAVFLMSVYLFFSDRHGTSSGSRWTIMGTAVKLAQSIGLHRDSSRWGIEEDEGLRRSNTFWELYVYDSWQCLTFGRPPSFALAHIDSKFPYPTDDPTGERTFDTWKHKFTSQCMSIVHDQAFGAKTPSYQTILQLDRKLRAFPVPAVLQVAGFGTSDVEARRAYPDTLPLVMQRHIVLAIREMNLLYMHRGFFARAISDHPKDPLGSPYGTSVIAAYRSAGSLVALVRNLDSQLPQPTERLWFLWTHLFSCSVVLGSIVTRCPSMSLAPSALVQLDSACELFSKVARTFRAEKVQTIMLGLRQKAHYALMEFREGRSPSVGILPQRQLSDPSSPHGGEDDDELTKLGGKTRLISQKEASKSPSPLLAHQSPNSLNPVVPLPLPSSEDYDPNVVSYLQSFGQTSANPLSMPLQGDTVYQGGGSVYNNRLQYTNGYGPTDSPPTQYSGVNHHHRPSLEHTHTLEHIQITPSGIPSTSGLNIDQMTAQSQQRVQPSNMGGQMFPQYFPVFDYGPAGGEYSSVQMNGNGHMPTESYSQTASPYPDANAYMPVHDERRRGSGSSESMAIPTTWMDFAQQMGLSN